MQKFLNFCAGAIMAAYTVLAGTLAIWMVDETVEHFREKRAERTAVEVTEE